MPPRGVLVGLAIACWHSMEAAAWFDGPDGANGNPFALSFCDAPHRPLWRLLSNGTINSGNGYCMDVFDRSSSNGAHVNAWECLATDKSYNQQFQLDASTSQLRASRELGSKCVEVTSADPLQGLGQLWDCDASRSALQQWVFDDGAGLIRLKANDTLCLSASGGARGTACGTRPGQPWCDVANSPHDRASALAAALTAAEQASVLSTNSFTKVDGGHTPGVRRLGIPPIQIHSEGLHGIRTGSGGGLPPVNTTLFPQVTGMAAALNASLWRAMGGVMRLEARALYNAMMVDGTLAGKGGGLFYWGPTQNIATRDPRWGRAQESIGSSVLLNAAYSVAFVRSFQAADPAAGPASAVAACVKHSWAYTLEASDGFDRHDFTARVGPEDALLTYLAAFRSSVQAGAPLQVMCSYNAVVAANASAGARGVPTCALGAVQNGLFRTEWGFDGMVVSDCDAVKDEWQSHKYVTSAAQATADSVLAGTDVDCGSTYGDIGAAVSGGLLTAGAVRLAATRALAARIATGEFDPPALQPLLNATVAGDSDSAASRRLALEAAEQSPVLLGNRNGTLPLRPAAGSTLAVIGPLGADTSFLKGSKQDYDPAHITSWAEGLQAAAAEGGFRVTVTAGSGVTAPTRDGLAQARAAAAAADSVVLAVGIDGSVEHEGGDRKALGLPPAQAALVDAVLGAARPGTPVVMAVGNGGPVSVGAQWNDTRLGAAVEALEGGQAAGTALARILLGSVRPSGALPYQVLPPSYAGLVNVSDMSMRAGPGRTFRYTSPSYPQQWPFGFWLGYDDVTPDASGGPLRDGFALTASASDLAEAARDAAGGSGGGAAFPGLQLALTLRNSGTHDASRPVMAFVSRRRGSGDATSGPVMALADATKVRVAAGGSARVSLDLARPLLLAASKTGTPPTEPTDRPGSCAVCEYASVDGTDAAVVAPGTYDVWVGGFGRIPAAVHRARAAAAGTAAEREEESRLAAAAAGRWEGGALVGSLKITGGSAQTVWSLPHGALPQ